MEQFIAALFAEVPVSDTPDVRRYDAKASAQP
jgi:hypothetical protein